MRAGRLPEQAGAHRGAGSRAGPLVGKYRQVVDFSVLSRFGEMTGSGRSGARTGRDFSEETPQACSKLRRHRAVITPGNQHSGHAVGPRLPNFGRADADALLQSPGRRKNGELPWRTELSTLEAEFEIVKSTLEEFAGLLPRRLISSCRRFFPAGRRHPLVRDGGGIRGIASRMRIWSVTGLFRVRTRVSCRWFRILAGPHIESLAPSTATSGESSRSA